jgi:hypothetical protein
MNSSWLPTLALLGLLFATTVACDAVVGREDDNTTSDATVALCEELGREICEQACTCGDGSCIVATGTSAAPSALIYDDLAQCENNFVSFACLNPPNPDSYYQDCIGTIDSCEERTVDGAPKQAATLPDSCQNPNGFGILCGSSECTRIPLDSPDNEVCCVSIDGDTHTSSCQEPALTCDGPSLGMTVACDGPEDCGGLACCGNLTAGFACTAEANCPEDIAQLCHRSADCPGDAQCIPATIAGFSISVCN